MSFDQDSRRRTYELPFRPYPGLTVWVRKPSFAALESLTDAVAHLGEDLSGDRLATPEKLRWWGVLFRSFAASLVGWNLIDRGAAVPAIIGHLGPVSGAQVTTMPTWDHSVGPPMKSSNSSQVRGLPL